MIQPVSLDGLKPVLQQFLSVDHHWKLKALAGVMVIPQVQTDVIFPPLLLLEKPSFLLSGHQPLIKKILTVSYCVVIYTRKNI